MGISLKTTTGKVLASLALVGAAAGVAGLGTYGAFTSSTAANAAVASGTVGIVLGGSGTAENRLSVGAAGLVSGDTVQRVVTLSNPKDNQDLSAVTLTTTADASSILNTDATNGLKVAIDECSVAWAEGGQAPAYTYTCPSGEITPVLNQRAVIGKNLVLSNKLSALTAGLTDYLHVTMTLPTSADSRFQAKSSTINFTFTAIQRAATNK